MVKVKPSAVGEVSWNVKIVGERLHVDRGCPERRMRDSFLAPVVFGELQARGVQAWYDR